MDNLNVDILNCNMHHTYMCHVGYDKQIALLLLPCNYKYTWNSSTYITELQSTTLHAIFISLRCIFGISGMVLNGHKLPLSSECVDEYHSFQSDSHLDL